MFFKKWKSKLKKTADNSNNILNYKFLAGEDCEVVKSAYGEFGKEPTNPIPVNGPKGEILYLNQLRIGKNNPILFHRISYTEVAGLAEAVDIFEVVSTTGAHWDILYFHMYHPRNSTRVPSNYHVTSSESTFANQPIGLGITDSVSLFPVGLIKVINQFYGNISDLSSVVQNLTNGTIYIRPQSHLQRLLQINNSSAFVGKLIGELSENYDEKYFINLLKTSDLRSHVFALNVAKRKKNLSANFLRECALSALVFKDKTLIDLCISVIQINDSQAHAALNDIDNPDVHLFLQSSNMLQMIASSFGPLLIPYLLRSIVSNTIPAHIKDHFNVQIDNIIYNR